MKQKRPYQQGDVQIVPVTDIPAKSNKVKATERGYVLAHGESGHFHTVDVADTVEAFGENGNDDITYLSLSAPAIVKHEEHKHIALPVGNYRIKKVREIDPFAEEIRNVAD